MANNRMYLKCSCGERFYLAEYYPSTGWYWPALQYGAEIEDSILHKHDAPDRFTDALDKFFDDHRHTPDMHGTNFVLEYEEGTVEGTVEVRCP